MEETTSGLAEAIRQIEETAADATEAQIITLATQDGAGGVSQGGIAVLKDGESQVLVSLAPLLAEANALEKKQRLERAAGPDRRTGTAQLQSLQSFIDHANRFKAEGSSAVWANAAARQLVSVLDYHPAGAENPARWGRHRGVYGCPLSEAWLAWGGGKAVELEQDDFAALLDGRDRELASGKLPSGTSAPEPSMLISLASNLEVYSHAQAKRERDPGTGKLKISFNEEKGVSGVVPIPPSFLVSIPVFEDAEPRTLEVRLRVAVEDARAKFTVQIHAAGDILRASFQELCATVNSQTALPVFTGVPEAT